MIACLRGDANRQAERPRRLGRAECKKALMPRPMIDGQTPRGHKFFESVAGLEGNCAAGRLNAVLAKGDTL